MRNLFSGIVFLFLIMIILIVQSAKAETGSEQLRNLNVEFKNINNEVMVQLRSLAAELNWLLNYNSSEKIVTISNDNSLLKLSLTTGTLNGASLLQNPELVKGRTYLGIDDIKALVSSLTDNTGPELLTGLYTDKVEYNQGEEITIYIKAYNISDDKLHLDFSSGQRYDLYLFQENKEVWRWSAGKFFTMALVRKELEIGEGLEYDIKLPDGLEKGEYVLQGELKTLGSSIIMNSLKLTIK